MVALILSALVDWRSGRAFMRNGSFWLRPVGEVCGVKAIVAGRPTPAPWSAAALAWFGDSEGLHRAAFIGFPQAELTPFERMHALDPIASALLRGVQS